MFGGGIGGGGNGEPGGGGDEGGGEGTGEVAAPAVVRVARAAHGEEMRGGAAWAMAMMAALVATEADAPARLAAALAAVESSGAVVGSEGGGGGGDGGLKAVRAAPVAAAGLVVAAVAEASVVTEAVVSALSLARTVDAPAEAASLAAAVLMEVRGSDPRTSGGMTRRCARDHICWVPFDRTNRLGY